MKTIWTILVAILLSSALAADPYVGYLYPASLQAGTTNTIIVGGQYFWKIQGGYVSGKGVEILGMELVPGFAPPTWDQKKYLEKWLDEIAKGNRAKPPLPKVKHLNEWRSNVWWQVLGDLNKQQLSLVEHYLYTPRNPLQMSPSLRQKLLVKVAVSKDAELGVRDFSVYNVAPGMSPPRPLIITSAPHIQEPLYSPPHRKLPSAPALTNLPCVLDGQIMPGETDSFTVLLKANEPVTFTVFGREFQPYIGDAVPGFFNPVLRIVDPNGVEAAFSDDTYHRPDPAITFTPKVDGMHVVEIRDNLYRGREDFVYVIMVEKGMKLDSFPYATGLFAPLEHARMKKAKVFSGKISNPGEKDDFVFEVTEPGKVKLDLFARRIGSPLDAALSVFDPEGNLICRLDDVTNKVLSGTVIQAEIDPVLTVDLQKVGTYMARIEDLTGHHGDEYGYELYIGKPEPSFKVYALKSSFSVVPWRRLWVKLHIVKEDGFNNPIRVCDTDVYKVIKNSIVPAASNRWDVLIEFAGTLKPDKRVHPMDMYAMAEIDGLDVTQKIVPADYYNQAFAWDHLVPARNFALKVSNPPPPKKKPKQVKKKSGKPASSK